MTGEGGQCALTSTDYDSLPVSQVLKIIYLFGSSGGHCVNPWVLFAAAPPAPSFQSCVCGTPTEPGRGIKRAKTIL